VGGGAGRYGGGQERPGSALPRNRAASTRSASRRPGFAPTSPGTTPRSPASRCRSRCGSRRSTRSSTTPRTSGPSSARRSTGACSTACALTTSRASTGDGETELTPKGRGTTGCRRAPPVCVVRRMMRRQAGAQSTIPARPPLSSNAREPFVVWAQSVSCDHRAGRRTENAFTCEGRRQLATGRGCRSSSERARAGEHGRACSRWAGVGKRLLLGALFALAPGCG
jgi:hypothetical protein